MKYSKIGLVYSKDHVDLEKVDKYKKDLGLIDGLGNSEQILREKFGENVEVKIFEKSKGWLAKKLSSSENQADKILNLIEERSIWQKYGF